MLTKGQGLGGGVLPQTTDKGVEVKTVDQFEIEANTVTKFLSAAFAQWMRDGVEPASLISVLDQLRDQLTAALAAVDAAGEVH